MSKNKLYYHNSACVTIASSNINILCDPWLTSHCYYGMWGKKPSSVNPFDTLVDIDYIFISHIHPDHYCPESLNKIFSIYGPKPILVADWGSSVNILYNKLCLDGFSENTIIFNELTFGNTHLISFPNHTDSSIDIDSFLLVHDQKYNYTVVNFNDCAPSEQTLTYIEGFLKDRPGLTLLCLGYSGAGPYPQNYYSPSSDRMLLLSKAEQKKQFFLIDIAPLHLDSRILTDFHLQVNMI